MLKATLSQFVQRLVIPAMVGDFMSFSNGTFHDFGMFFNELSQNEKSRVDMALLEYVEEFWGQYCVGTVIKGHGNVGALDMNGREAAVVSHL